MANKPSTYGDSRKNYPNGESANEKLLMTSLEPNFRNGDKSYDVSSEDDEKVGQGGRETWDRKTEYLLSMIGYCVGLGNLWRFPYVCIRNGGGAFLIPFLICLILVAMPVYLLEVTIGQFTSRGPFHAWKICPLFKGIGFCMFWICVLLAWYYNMILAWSLIYLVNAVKSPQPWTQCGQAWNTEQCITRSSMLSDSSNSTNNSLSSEMFVNSSLSSEMFVNNSLSSEMFVNNSLSSEMFVNNSLILTTNITYGNNTANNVSSVLSTEEFWKYSVLEASEGFHDMGGLPWHTSIALLVATLIVLAGIIKGIHSSGKVVYVTATLPYLLITVLLIRGLTLPGALDGILFYVKPDFSKLLLVQTWIEASIQVFYSLGPSWGALFTMASYNKFTNNCVIDTLILTSICEGTSIFGGFASFAILGHMSYMAKISIEDFARSGPGLAFIVYPEGISYLPLPQLWGVLFFIMLLTLGLDSQFANVETIVTTLIDQWPNVLRKRRIFVTIAFIACFYLVSLPFAARGGIFLFQLVDWYIAAFAILATSVLENVIVGWIYGADNFLSDIELMIGHRPNYFFAILWKYVSPVLLNATLGFTLCTYTPPTYGDYVYGPWGIAFGWTIAVSGFVFVPTTAIYVLIKSEGTFIQRLKKSCKPDSNYGPADPKLRAVYRLRADDLEPFSLKFP